jgi:hypothetical protein
LVSRALGFVEGTGLGATFGLSALGETFIGILMAGWGFALGGGAGAGFGAGGAGGETFAAGGDASRGPGEPAGRETRLTE